MKPIVPNVIYRLQARAAIARNRGTILLIALLSMLFLMLSQAFVQMGLNRDYDDLAVLLTGVSENTLTGEGVVELSQKILTAAKRDLVIAGGCLVMWLATAFLSTGRTASELKLLRGQEITVGDVLSRAAIWPKAIAHRLYLILRIVLWMVPGFALMVLGQMMAVNAALRGRLDDLNFLTSYALQVHGMVGMFFLAGWAYLRYAVSGIILADRPGTGVLESVRLSKVFMKGRMGRMVLMALMFIAWNFVASLIASMLTGISQVIGLTVDLAFNVFLVLYYDTTLCALYLDQTAPQPEQAAGEKSPLSDENRETQPEQAAEEKSPLSDDHEETRPDL